MRIGILGTGNVARAIGAGAQAAGHDVRYGSRDAESRRKELDLPAVPVADAAAHGEIVVNAIGGNASLALLPTLRDPLTGKVLLDIAIDLTEDMQLVHVDFSLGEQLQTALPGTRVVKALCTMDSSVMVSPQVLAGASSVFLSGDDDSAKQQVDTLLAEFGWPAGSRVDLGGIATARAQEHFALFFVAAAGALDSHTFNIRLVPAAES
ncbi:NADP oxidoreductase coenzyme F420-dependent [Streptomyces sp. YIM 130001]|uniref:NADPH-dependent F420 reductase n=1 Tax=Streptomyces sp. YIM 130001 TaxID=2259644 RepID=UPI000E64EB11|nr:NAD(P)-binding domain-containing protein [Streptomyces sp. YIM 130001]RII11907.1 NADP oxidoreductase coenzyme F420-dependent [Streptomyces sp. YIM 130001]